MTKLRNSYTNLIFSADCFFRYLNFSEFLFIAIDLEIIYIKLQKTLKTNLQLQQKINHYNIGDRFVIEQTVVDFFTKVKEDKSLQEEVGSIFANNEGADANQPLADLATKYGYKITAEQMEELRLAIKAKKEEGELNEEQLESVAGGVGALTLGAAVGAATAALGLGAAALNLTNAAMKWWK